MRSEHFLYLKKQHNLGQNFGTSKMHLSPPPPSGLGCCPFLVRKRAKIRHRYNQVPHLTHDTNGNVVLLLLIRCLLLLPMWESVNDLWFVVRYFMSILVLQSS